MATNSREARRRKILERGSDRLALITGQIQTIPSSSSSASDPQIHHQETTTQSSPPPIPRVQEHLLDQIAASPSEIEEKVPDPTLPEQSDTNTEALRAIDSQVQQLLSSLAAQNAAAAAPPSSSSSSRPRSSSSLSVTKRQPLFTASGVSNAIAETERSRVLFSVAVAFLVVLAHFGFPLLGTSTIVKTVLGFRPLYLLLVTNVTFVIARILGKQRLSDTTGAQFIPPMEGGYEWATYLGKAIELGLVAQKVLDALFMDCAVYVIIVVCGLSFA